ncbi:MAG: hypothetical protein LBB07_03105 [Bifidobacteriaceae bacterium]|nr:hypothetical protein [Bifidobacteriaceae bacterium]
MQTQNLKSPIDLEIEHKKHLPWGYIITIFSILVLPFWIGRNTALLYAKIPNLNPVFYLFLGQISALAALLALILLIAVKNKKAMFVVFSICFSAVQFLCGFAFLKVNYYDSTQIVFGDRANLANAISIGIIASGAAFIIYILFILVAYIVISRQSKWVWITRTKYNWLFFIILQIVEFIFLFNMPAVWQLIK